MAPQPPSRNTQAGRFKPKKPATASARRIQNIGESLGAPPPPAAATAPVPLSDSRRERDRGGGRGGRGGGGGGRFQPAPLQQGEAFFGATPAATAPQTTTSRRSIAAAAAAATSLRDGARGRSTGRIKAGASSTTVVPSAPALSALDEEVVGRLEQPIGKPAVGPEPPSVPSNASARQAVRTSSTEGDASKEKKPSPKKTRSNNDDDYYYDSDSSMEVENELEASPSNIQQPLSLPFPSQQQGAQPSEAHAGIEACFDHAATTETWTLWQLPSRLPCLQQSSTQHASSLPARAVADVATPPVDETAFDATLFRAPPGRVGKIRQYKSGRTELVWDSEHGTICMPLVPGVPAGFSQRVASIDSSRWVDLGIVGPTVLAAAPGSVVDSGTTL